MSFPDEKGYETGIKLCQHIWSRLDFRLSFFRNSLSPSCCFLDYMPLIHSWWSAWSCVMWLIKFDKAYVCRRFWLIGSYCEEEVRPFHAQGLILLAESRSRVTIYILLSTVILIQMCAYENKDFMHLKLNTSLTIRHCSLQMPHLICLQVWAVR